MLLRARVKCSKYPTLLKAHNRTVSVLCDEMLFERFCGVGQGEQEFLLIQHLGLRLGQADG